VLKQGDRFQAGRRPRNRDRAARGRWSTSCDTCVVMLSLGAVIIKDRITVLSTLPEWRLAATGTYMQIRQKPSSLNFQVVSVTEIRSQAQRFIDVQIM
jgi:hypothetical protein